MDFDFISINEVLNSVANCSRVNSPMDSIESTMALSNEELSDASKFYIAKSCGGYTEDELSNALRYQQGAGDLIEALMRHRHSRAGSNGFPIPRSKPTDKESTNPVTVSDLIRILESPASWYQRIIYDSLAIRERLLSEKEVSMDQLFKRAPDAPKVKPYHSIYEDIEATSFRVGFERQHLIDWLKAEGIEIDQDVEQDLKGSSASDSDIVQQERQDTPINARDMARRGVNASTAARLAAINATNLIKLADGARRQFHTMQEVYDHMLEFFDAEKTKQRHGKVDFIFDEMSRNYGLFNSGFAFKASTIKTKVSSMRTKNNSALE